MIDFLQDFEMTEKFMKNKKIVFRDNEYLLRKSRSENITFMISCTYKRNPIPPQHLPIKKNIRIAIFS